MSLESKILILLSRQKNGNSDFLATTSIIVRNDATAENDIDNTMG